MKTEKHFTEENMRKIIRIVSSLQNKTNEALDRCINPYQEDKVYSVNDITYYNGSLWICKSISTGNPPVVGDAHWEVIEDQYNEISEQDIINMMNEVTPEQWTKLAEVIVDDQISANKVYSSSKTYTSIQDALDQAKTYTLNEIAKQKGMTYVIANSTANMTSSECFYLLDNGTNNYDIYIVLADGTPKMVTSMNNIQLDGYLTTEEASNTYMTITTADGKYSTITTTDGLRTDLNNHTNDAVAHLTQAERDKLVTTDDIITTLSSTSTNDEIVGAKTIFDNLFKVLNQNEIIPENADLNTYLTPGAYTCKSSIIAKTILNSPHVTSNFKLIVNNNTGNITSTFNGYQMIVASVGATNPTFHIYYRGVVVTDMTNITDNCFSPWEKLVTDKNEKYKIKDYNNDLKVNNTITKLEDLLKLVPRGETWYIPDFNIDQTVTDYGFPEGMQTWGSMTITNSTSNGHYLIELQTNNNYQFYKRWLGETKNGAAGSNQAYQVNWKMCCTTSVADIAYTELTATESDTNYEVPDTSSIESYYYVKNGICYVQAAIKCVAADNAAYHAIIKGMPKPERPVIRYVDKWNRKPASDKMAIMVVSSGNVGVLQVRDGEAGMTYWYQFSYPVAES